MEWGLQFQTHLDDGTFPQFDDWRFKSNVCFRPGSFFNELFENLKISLPAVGITGTVLFHCTNENSMCLDSFGSGCCYCNEMGISKGHIGGRYVFTAEA